MSFALVGTLAAFVLITVLANRKVPLYLDVLIGTLVVGLSCGYGIVEMGATVWQALQEPSTVELLSVIAMICISSYLLQRFGLLKRAVEALDRLLPSTKITIMLVPMLIGCLTVTGGAIISAPMVDALGDRLDIPPDKRSSINLLYRHAAHFMFPFVPGIILASSLGGFPATELALMMSPITIALVSLGYFFLLRTVPFTPEQRENHFTQDLFSFLLNASPILLPLLLSIGVGLNFILSLAIGSGVALLIIFYNQMSQSKADAPTDAPTIPLLRFQDVFMGLYQQRMLLLTAASIMIFRGMITATNVLSPFISEMLARGIPLALLCAFFPFLIGYSTGQISSAIGICWPLIIPAGYAGYLVPLAMLMYCSGYLGYFFSPLHLCTVLSNGYFKVELSTTYRNLLPVFVPIPILMVVLYTLFGH